jgi:hypothetical protein
MDFVPLLAATALIWKAVDFVRFIRARDTDSALTQLVVWAVGVAVTFLLAGTNYADGIVIGDLSLGRANWESLLLIGLSLGSSASALVDFKRAIDNTDSARVPGPNDYGKHGIREDAP